MIKNHREIGRCVFIGLVGIKTKRSLVAFFIIVHFYHLRFLIGVYAVVKVYSFKVNKVPCPVFKIFA